MLEAVQQGVAAGGFSNITVSYDHGVRVGQLDTSAIGAAQSAASDGLHRRQLVSLSFPTGPHATHALVSLCGRGG